MRGGPATTVSQLLATNTRVGCQVVNKCLCRTVGAYHEMRGHALCSGRQEQLSRISNGPGQLLALLHVEHQVRLRLGSAILRDDRHLSLGCGLTRQTSAVACVVSIGSLATHSPAKLVRASLQRTSSIPPTSRLAKATAAPAICVPRTAACTVIIVWNKGV